VGGGGGGDVIIGWACSPALRLARDAVHRGLAFPLKEGFEIEADFNALAFQSTDAVEGMLPPWKSANPPPAMGDAEGHSPQCSPCERREWAEGGADQAEGQRHATKLLHRLAIPPGAVAPEKVQLLESVTSVVRDRIALTSSTCPH
jgi:hypothetical protein